MTHLPYVLRPCAPGDEQALSLVASATLLEAFAAELEGADILAHARTQNSEAKYQAWLRDPAVHIAVAETKAAPIGYAVLCPPDLPVPLTGREIELRRIYLLHRFQKQGIGAALMHWAIEEARSLGHDRLLLGVYGGNDPAIAFYEHLGFTKIGTRQFLVGTTLHDDFVMARPL